MTTTQFSVDVVVGLEGILPSYKLYVPSFIMEELLKIKNRSKGKHRIAASVAIKIAQTPPLEIKKMELEKGEMVDDALLRNAKVLCTNDRELRLKARKRSIPVVYLRQKSYLSIDGYLPTQ